MNNDKTYIGRKRTVLIEKISYRHTVTKEGVLRRFGLPIFFNADFLRKNRFVVEMQIDDKTINNENIQGFSITYLGDQEKTIRINTAIHIDDWITNYEKVNIIKVYLLDSLGNEHKEFDFDVIYKGYTLDCDYREDALIVPYFLYKILE